MTLVIKQRDKDKTYGGEEVKVRLTILSDATDIITALEAGTPTDKHNEYTIYYGSDNTYAD